MANYWIRSTGPLVLAVICSLLAGCASSEVPTLVPVKGRVLLNGEGVTAGSVYLNPGATAEYSKDNPSSLLQSDGSFTFKTFPFGEGVALGDYVVTLAPELAQRLSKPEYALAEKSPWKVKVTESGVTDLVLDVK